ncbi:MAG: type II secretion system protein GspM [Rhodocyclaceae bacterium]|nr:type II secretion system protein GspM [Rhodocyclaceae bacterium]
MRQMKETMGTKTASLKAHWQTVWQQRSPQEQRALRWLAWIVIGALLGQTLWSLEHARRLLQRQLPVLAEQVEQAHALRDRWRQLEAGREQQRIPRADTVRSEIAQRLPELGKEVVAEWNAGGELSLKGKVDFSVWLKWVAAIHEDFRLVLSRCRVTNSAGGVDIEARFSPAQSQP